MEQRKKAVVALGMFDGMHLGHRELLRRTAVLAQQLSAISVVYTFSNHPAEVLGGKVRLLTTPVERKRLMGIMGMRQVHMEPFTMDLARLSPEDFLEKLNALWRVTGTVCGFNYSFGNRGEGTPETLESLGRINGFVTEVVPPVLYDGHPVSSTRVRGAIEQGDMALANALLARPYALSGKVVSNRRFGRRIGFPTANIDGMEDRVLPENGVYATLAQTGGSVYRAVTNVGRNPTVDGKTLTVETHLIGFDGSLYGKKLTVSFLRRLRGEVRFPSVEALKAQIEKDVENAMAPDEET